MESGKFKTGLTSFGWNLYRCLSNKEGNVFISPHSVSSALMLACLGAKGDTAKQILTAIGTGDVDNQTAHRLYKGVNDVLFKAAEGGNTDLSIGNRLFSRLSLGVVEQFVKESADFYGNSIGKMDFAANPEECRAAINKWVEDQTKQKIKDLLPSGSVDASTNLVLVNAIYFKGKWDKPFKAEKTKKEDFFISTSDKIQVDMMNAELDVPFVKNEELKCSMISVSYQSQGMAMIIVRPDQIDGLGALEKQLSQEKFVSLCDDAMYSIRCKVEIGLPKFTMTETSDLTKVLPGMGIQDLFDDSKADMTGLTTDSNISISRVIHKAFIEVSEEGTEAAAATAMIARMCMMPMGTQSFKCDRPFLFVLRELETGAILFIGRYSKPE